MPVTQNYNRSKSVVVNSTPITLRLKAAEKNNTPALFPSGAFNSAPLPGEMWLAFDDDLGNPLHNTIQIGADTYEFLDGNSLTAADYTISNNANIPVQWFSGNSIPNSGTLGDLVTAINATRIAYDAANAYLQTDGVTPMPLQNGTENLKANAAVIALVEEFQTAGMLRLFDADAPGGTPKPTGRSLVVTFSGFPSGQIVIALDAFNTPGTALVSDGGTPGTTGALDCRIQANADPDGSPNYLDVFQLVATPALDSSGNLTLAITVTPYNGDGSSATPLAVPPQTHPHNMDAFQAAAGDPRQP